MSRNTNPTLSKNEYINIMNFINEFGDLRSYRNGTNNYELLDFSTVKEKDKTYLLFTMRNNFRKFTTSATGNKEYYPVEEWKVDITGDKNRSFEFELSQVIKERYETLDGENLNSYV